MRSERFLSFLKKECLPILNNAVFAMVLSYFLWRWMGTARIPVAGMAFSYLLTVLFWKLAFRFWKISFPLLFVLLAVAWFTWPDAPIDASSPFLWRKAEPFYRSVEWALHWNHLKGPMPVAFSQTLRLITTFLAVLTAGRRPFVPLLIALWITPLFFIPELGADPRWRVWFFLGMASVLIAWIRTPWSSLADPVPLAAVFLVTLALSFLTTPRTLFSESLYNQINRRTAQHDAMGDAAFGLSEIGFPSSTAPIGGPVTLSKEPYLIIQGPPFSFYLRGSVYTEFAGDRWRTPAFEPSEPFVSFGDLDNAVSEAQLSALYAPKEARSERDWFYSSRWPLSFFSDEWFTPSFVVQQPLRGHKQTVFLPGPTLNISTLEELDFNKSEPRNDSEREINRFRWNASGLVMAEKPIQSMIQLAAETQSPLQSRAALSPVFLAGYLPRTIDAPRRYEPLVREKDPALHAILYERLPAAPNDTLQWESVLSDFRRHIQEHYRYSLDVPRIPTDQSFLSWLLEHRQGYCVYYGSLGTLLLRDVGIDARYAEGFLVPSMPVVSVSFNERVVTGESGHAWTEIYLDGFGWFIYDLTPSSHLDSLSSLADPRRGLEEPSDPETEPRDQRDPNAVRPEPSTTEADLPETEPQPISSRSIPVGWLRFLGGAFATALLWAWRRTAYRRRHDADRLRARWHRKPNALVRAVWADLLRMHNLVLPAAQPQDTPRAVIMALARQISIKELRQIAESIALVERALYSSLPTAFDSLAPLLSFYSTAEQKLAAQLPRPKWWLFRWLIGPKPPL